MTDRFQLGRAGLYAFLVLALAFMMLPIAIVVVDSFNSSSFGAWPPPGFSTRWYANLFHNGGFGPPAVRSVELALAATACSLVLGTLAALAIARFRFPGRRAVQGFVAAPLIVPKVAIGIAAFILFLKVGLYGSFGSLVLAHTVITLPFVITLAVAGFARVDHMLEEVATDLGAVPRQMFFRATLPQMRGPMIAAAVFSFIISFDELDASIFLVGQHTNTLPTAMFIYMEKYQDPTLAALSTLLIGASLVAAVAIAFLIARVGGIRLFAQRGGAAAALEEGV